VARLVSPACVEELPRTSAPHGIKAQDPNTTFAQACTIVDSNAVFQAGEECASDVGFDAAVATASNADQIVLALGETRGESGEAESRSNIDLPGLQQELIDRIAALGKPFTVVLFNGRPLTLAKVAASSPSILEAWFPGVQAGNAVADVLFGKVNPGGKPAYPTCSSARRRCAANPQTSAESHPAVDTVAVRRVSI